MALKISLKPGEKVVVNGAVFSNGERRASLLIHNKVSILREKDIMQEKDVNTPARRIYFPIMLAYIHPDKELEYYQEFVQRMSEFMNVVERAEIKALCLEISSQVMNRQYYKAMVGCRKLIEFEEAALKHVA